MEESQKFSFRIAVVGDNEVGKTSLMKKFTKGDFSREYTKTVGAHFSVFECKMEGDKITLLFGDLAGGDFFLHIRTGFYRYTRAAIIVCSLEDTEQGKLSFTHILDWHNEVVKYCGDIPIYIFANKVDAVDESELEEKILIKLVEENKFHGYYYTSAETEQSVNTAFSDISMELYKKFKPLASQHRKKKEKKKRKKR